jgi:HEPN domain-containing protein
MIDMLKQIDYWKKGSLSDIETADILIDKKKYREGLFFRHLSIEKMLKALYVKTKNDIPPKTHNLFQLTENIDLKTDENNSEFFGILMNYQLEGRYPDSYPLIPDEVKVKKYLTKTKDIQQWLINKL